MSNIQWAAEAENLVTYIKQGKSFADIAKIYSVDRSTVSKAVNRLQSQGKIPTRDKLLYNVEHQPTEFKQQELTIEYPDKKEARFEHREFLKRAIELQDVLKAKSFTQKEATVKITSDKPIAVGFSSDWHVGGKGTDYRALLQHTDLFINTPRLYMAAVGDYGNFFVKGGKMKSAMFSELFGPQEQADVLQGIFEDLGQKVIVRTTGNHDDWIKDETAIDIGNHFFAGCSHAPYLREGGGVNLRLGDEFDGFIDYRIYLKHKYRFHSSLNPTNSHKRMHDIESPFDVGVLGHRHIPEVLHADRWSGTMGKEIIALLTGTYKTDDTWARANGFGQSSQIGVPTVIFFPKEKRMMAFKYVEDAVLVMELLDYMWKQDPEKALHLIYDKYYKLKPGNSALS